MIGINSNRVKIQNRRNTLYVCKTVKACKHNIDSNFMN